jgi:mRNA interferase MazF
MTNPKPGEVYWVDLGLAAKYRPLMVVSREDSRAERALAVCIPLTTEIRGGDYEVPIPRVRWMPGADQGVANVQGITSVEHHRLERRAGRFEPQIIKTIREAIAWMIELENLSDKGSS